ncbi:MAG: phosphoesterase [Rhodoferax sp.]|nr:phosphoesterase [Rhodoferax sp.]MCF8210753.1 phosphoesterase [Rhodoferax sp.]
MPDTVVFYHGQCCDGFAAAFAAWLSLRDQAEYVPCVYGDNPPDVTGKRVYILDFSFDYGVMERLDRQATELVLLDHHKTAKEKLQGFTCRCGGLVFDLHRSGARMAWDHFQPQRAVPKLIAHVQDRDLWTWKLPESQDYLAALDFEPSDFERWLTVLNFSQAEHEAFLVRGRAMNDKFQSLCDAIAEPQTTLPVSLMGQSGLMVNASGQFTSDVGNRLALRSGTFGLVWRLDTATSIKVGLRSVAPFDVEALARAFGGGGHPQASAFRMPVARLPELLTGDLKPL